MFDDVIDRIKIVPVIGDEDMLEYASGFNPSSVIATGIFNNNWASVQGSFCEKFYKQVLVDPSERWSSFFIPEVKTDILYSYAGQNVFLHQDTSRNLTIKDSYIKENTYSPRHSLGSLSKYTIFDYLPILERVDEIHCIDSSFACFIDHCQTLKDKKKYIHRYVRENNENPKYINNWEILYE